MEGRRIFFQKKVIGVALLLFLINLGVLTYGCEKEMDLYDYDSSTVTQQEYGKRISKRKEAVEKNKDFQIFDTEDSFAGKDSEKEAADFKKVENITVEDGNNRVVTAVVSNEAASWILLLFMFFLVLQFFTERESAVWTVIHTMPKGRGALALRRCGVLLIGAAGFGAFLYGSSFILTSILFGGNAGWQRSIQSIAAFVDIPYALPVWEYCLCFAVMHILAAFVLGLVLFFVFSCCKEKILAMLLLAFMGVVEWLFALIPIQSNLVMVKYWNLFFFADVTECLVSYRNIPFPVLGIIERSSYMVLALVITGGIFFLLSIWVNHKIMPTGAQSIFGKTLHRLTQKLRQFLSHLPGFGLEVYKQWMGQKKIWILVALLVLCVYTGKESRYFSNPTETFVNEFYEQFSGSVSNPQADAYLNKIQKENEKLMKRVDDATEDFQDGKMSATEYEKISNVLNAYEGQLQGYDILQKERKRLLRLEKETGQHMEYVNQTGYEHLLKKCWWDKENQTALLAMVALVLLLFDSFSYEQKVGMEQVFCATKRGRRILTKDKLCMSVGYAFLVWLLVYGEEVLRTWNSFGLPQPGVPVQSIACVDGVPLHCSIGVYLGIVYLLRLFLLIMFAWIILGVSSLVRQEISLFVSMCVFVLPSAAYCIGLEAIGVLALSKPVAFLHYQEKGMGIYGMYVGTFLVMAVAGVWFVLQKWRKTK